jgi:hypothetical protein
MTIAYDIETTVRDRYADGAREVQPALCAGSKPYPTRLSPRTTAAAIRPSMSMLAKPSSISAPARAKTATSSPKRSEPQAK